MGPLRVPFCALLVPYCSGVQILSLSRIKLTATVFYKWGIINVILDPKRDRQSPTFHSKSSKFLGETMKVDGHISGTVGPNLLIFDKIGANIVNF